MAGERAVMSPHKVHERNGVDEEHGERDSKNSVPSLTHIHTK